MNSINEYWTSIIEGSGVVLLVLGFLIHRYRKTILKSNIKKFLVILLCGLASAWVPWTIFGVVLGFLPILFTTVAIYFWHDKVGSKSYVKTFLTIACAASFGAFLVGASPCNGFVSFGIFKYSWQSILLASVLAAFLLAKRGKKK